MYSQVEFSATVYAKMFHSFKDFIQYQSLSRGKGEAPTSRLNEALPRAILKSTTYLLLLRLYSTSAEGL